MSSIVDVWQVSKHASGLFSEHFGTEKANQMPSHVLAVMNISQNSQKYIQGGFLEEGLQL